MKNKKYKVINKTCNTYVSQYDNEGLREVKDPQQAELFDKNVAEIVAKELSDEDCKYVAVDYSLWIGE